ncbi:hypothetical protein BDV96DRAFT_561093 [Lophiotrema nucula]|uniref:Uncharacterized protein n=1 Tax=Lophiotrema nucula TaxID=690887 RepID=A0A6A5ZSC1_9PLEO|nr:hypothetical protein BDV96DRAFT_561093 [Lophiotrema nucula]
MLFPKFRSFIADPLNDNYGHGSYFQNYIHSTPIVLPFDIISTILSLITLGWKGVPIRENASHIPHMLNRRAEEPDDALHMRIRVARLRLWFSIFWTTALIQPAIAGRRESLGQTIDGLTWLESVAVLASILSALTLTITFFGRQDNHGDHWHGQDSFKTTLQKYSLSSATFDSIYRRVGNWTIRLHIVLWVLTLRWIVPLILIGYRWQWLWMLFRWYIELPGFLLLIFLLSVGLASVFVVALTISLPAHLYRLDSAAFQSVSSSRDVRYLFGGIVASLLYGLLFKRWKSEFLHLLVWLWSDFIIWTAFEGYMACCMMRRTHASSAFIMESESQKANED